MKKIYKILLLTIIIFISIIFLLFIALRLVFNFDNKAEADKIKNKSNTTFINENTPDTLKYLFLDSVNIAAETLSKKLGGKRITICITGLDTRFGTNTNHADANHVVNVWLDSAIIEIISVPRGTYVNMKIDDTLNLNYLANVRALKGRERYHKVIAEISGAEKIDYYVEFGFSQAIGLMEILGFKGKAVQMLRVLRSRKAFGVGDYQRAYNQGQFIRQMILSRFNNVAGTFKDLIITGGLLIVDSNLPSDTVNYIINELKKRGFPKSPQDVFVRLKPEFTCKLIDYNFTNLKATDSIYKKIANSAKSDSEATDIKMYDASKVTRRVMNKLKNIISDAEDDTLKNPERVISRLKPHFIKKSWYQISNENERNSIRNKICLLLIKSYQKTNKQFEAKKVREFLTLEEKIKQKIPKVNKN